MYHTYFTRKCICNTCTGVCSAKHHEVRKKRKFTSTNTYVRWLTDICSPGKDLFLLQPLSLMGIGIHYIISIANLSAQTKHSLTKMELVAEFVSISLSDTVPRDPARFPPFSPPTPSPALLLKSLSAPSVSPELLLT